MDRNNLHCVEEVSGDTSLSARRAWIEITSIVGVLATLVTVALRKESVDRNTKSPLKDNTTDRSLSARRAWIEILCC